jgi:1,2-diacylglycerol 3-alpha-glucosyltransferase
VRLAVVFDRLGPYHCARLAAVAQELETVAIELSAETKEYAWSAVNEVIGFERKTLFSQGTVLEKVPREIAQRIGAALSSCWPDAVAIPGWSNPGALAALGWCCSNRIPAILMSESTAEDEPRRWWREVVKRRIVPLYSTALVGGQRHVDYLVALGMPRERVFTGYDAVDNGYFARGAKQARGQMSEVRRQYGLPENYFLASARFIAKKNLPMLIRAYAAYRERSSLVTGHSLPWHLVLLGDGPLRSEIRQLISDLGLQNYVMLPGFKQYNELPVYYGLAKVFVHASTTEQWGLVVNEAMSSGLPVLVSDRCGCASDLVVEGSNGKIFDPYDLQSITAAMLEFANKTDAERASLGEAACERIFAFSPEAFATGLREAATLTRDEKVKRTSLTRGMLLRILAAR